MKSPNLLDQVVPDNLPRANEKVNVLGMAGFMEASGLPHEHNLLIKFSDGRARIFRISPPLSFQPAALRQIALLSECTTYDFLKRMSRAFTCSSSSIFAGEIQRANSTTISGWVKLTISPDPVKVRLLWGGIALAGCVADKRRPLLGDLNYPSIDHGFDIDISSIQVPSFDTSDVKIESEDFGFVLTRYSADATSMPQRLTSISKQASKRPLATEVRAIIHTDQRILRAADTVLIVHVMCRARTEHVRQLGIIESLVSDLPELKALLIVSDKPLPLLFESECRNANSKHRNPIRFIGEQDVQSELELLGPHTPVVICHLDRLPAVSIVHALLLGRWTSKSPNKEWGLSVFNEDGYALAGTVSQASAAYKRGMSTQYGLPKMPSDISNVDHFSYKAAVDSSILLVCDEVDYEQIETWWANFCLENLNEVRPVMAVFSGGFRVTLQDVCLRSLSSCSDDQTDNLIALSIKELACTRVLCFGENIFHLIERLVSITPFEAIRFDMPEVVPQEQSASLIADLSEKGVLFPEHLLLAGDGPSKTRDVLAYLARTDRSQAPTILAWISDSEAEIFNTLRNALVLDAGLGWVLPISLSNRDDFKGCQFARDPIEALRSNPSFAISINPDDSEIRTLLSAGLVVVVYGRMRGHFSANPLVVHCTDKDELKATLTQLIFEPGSLTTRREKFDHHRRVVAAPYTSEFLKVIRFSG